MIRAIVAADEKWGIGKKNDLLFRLPEDMKFFRETTLGSTVCMGYNTLLSFPGGKPLPKRKNIVICPRGRRTRRRDMRAYAGRYVVRPENGEGRRIRHRRRDVLSYDAALLRRGTRNQGRGGRRSGSVLRRSGQIRFVRMHPRRVSDRRQRIRNPFHYL